MKQSVPRSLRAWFIVHFFADILFGLPLLFAPNFILPLFGWTTYDPIMSRLVGAALMGIGIESLLGRDASLETYRAMLNLKVIWASSALIGIGLGIAEGAPASAWLFFSIFAVFWMVWMNYWLRLKSLS
jgi:hypothetical protein